MNCYFKIRQKLSWSDLPHLQQYQISKFYVFSLSQKNMIEQSDKSLNYKLQEFWCHYCQQQFSCHLRPGVDDITCPRCSNDFCQQITQSSNPSKFEPFQKPFRPRVRRIPRYTTQAVLVALAQYSEEVSTEKYRQINEEDIRKLRIRVQRHIQECSICGQEFKLNFDALRCPCGHIYHVECLSEWLEYKNNCPKCRVIVLQQDK